MTLHKIKQISIREYLNDMGIRPVKDYEYYGMYYCPYREDRNASFKVDYNKNVWCDFGTNEGGSIIDLLMKINNCSLQETITNVNQYVNTIIRQMNNFSFHQAFDDEPTTTIQNILSCFPHVLDFKKTAIHTQQITIDFIQNRVSRAKKSIILQYVCTQEAQQNRQCKCPGYQQAYRKV